MCARIRLLCVKRLVRTYMDYQFLQRLGDSVFRICWFVRCTNDLILMFVNSSDVSTAVVMDCLEDPSEGCDLQGSFADNLYVLIGPSWGSFFWGPSRSLFHVVHVIQRLVFTSDQHLLSNTITQCSNITVHYASSV